MLSNANKSGTTARDASNAAGLKEEEGKERDNIIETMKRLGSRSMMSCRYTRMIVMKLILLLGDDLISYT